MCLLVGARLGGWVWTVCKGDHSCFGPGVLSTSISSDFSLEASLCLAVIMDGSQLLTVQMLVSVLVSHCLREVESDGQLDGLFRTVTVSRKA